MIVAALGCSDSNAGPKTNDLQSISVSLTPVTAAVGGVATASATGTDSHGRNVTLSDLGWSSSSPSVATISNNGSITAISAGTTTISAVSSGRSAQADFVVTRVPPRLATIAISLAASTIVVNSATAATAVGSDQYGAPIAVTSVAWSSSNNAVAAISSSGNVTGVAVGTATLTATSGAVSGQAAIVVNPIPPILRTIQVTLATSAISVGQATAAMFTAKDQYGAAFAVNVAWASSDASVATVDSNGIVRALKSGSSTITATSGTVQGQAILTVVP